MGHTRLQTRKTPGGITRLVPTGLFPKGYNWMPKWLQL